MSQGGVAFDGTVNPTGMACGTVCSTVRGHVKLWDVLVEKNPKPLHAWLVLLILFDGCECSENCQLFVRLC